MEPVVMEPAGRVLGLLLLLFFVGIVFIGMIALVTFVVLFVMSLSRRSGLQPQIDNLKRELEEMKKQTEPQPEGCEERHRETFTEPVV